MQAPTDYAKDISDRFLGESRSRDLWLIVEKLDRDNEEEFGKDTAIAAALMLGKNGASATAAIGSIPLLKGKLIYSALYVLAMAAAQLQDKENLSPAVAGLVANAVNELAKICIESPYSQISMALEE